MNKTLIVLIAALALIPFTLLGVSGSVESVSSPYPLLTAIPLFLLQKQVSIIIPAFLFLLWNSYLFTGRGTVPKRTSVAFFLLAGLTVLYFGTSWSYGAQYQGLNHTKNVCLVNIFIISLLGLVWGIAIKRNRFASNFAFSWVLFLWLSWQAFPYLGEMP